MSSNAATGGRRTTSMSLSGKPSHHHTTPSGPAANGVGEKHASSKADQRKELSTNASSSAAGRGESKKPQQQQQQAQAAPQNGTEQNTSSGTARASRSERHERTTKESNSRSTTPQANLADAAANEGKLNKEPLPKAKLEHAADMPSPRKQNLKVKIAKLNKIETRETPEKASSKVKLLPAAGIHGATKDAIDIDQFDDCDDEILSAALRIEGDEEEDETTPRKTGAEIAAGKPIVTSTPSFESPQKLEGTKSEPIKPVASYSQIGGRRAIRRTNAELDSSQLTNTSMNVTIGSEIPNQSLSSSSYFFFGRRKRDASSSSSIDVSSEYEECNKKRRLDMSSIFSAVSFPITALRSFRFSRANAANADVDLSQSDGGDHDDDEVNDIQNISGAKVQADAEKINAADANAKKAQPEPELTAELLLDEASGLKAAKDDDDDAATEINAAAAAADIEKLDAEQSTIDIDESVEIEPEQAKLRRRCMIM